MELNHAFTRKMNHLLRVMKVLQRFKALRARKQQRDTAGGVGSPLQGEDAREEAASSFDPALEKAKAEEIETLISRRRRVMSHSEETDGAGTPVDKSQGHDVGDQEPLFLGIGTGARDDFAMDEAAPNIVADSPTAVSFDVYHKAYEEAVEKLQANQKTKPTLYLTRFVSDQERPGQPGEGSEQDAAAPAGGKLAQLVSQISLKNPTEAEPSTSDDAGP